MISLEEKVKCRLPRMTPKILFWRESDQNPETSWRSLPSNMSFYYTSLVAFYENNMSPILLSLSFVQDNGPRKVRLKKFDWKG
jgi:hypothetical protein